MRLVDAPGKDFLSLKLDRQAPSYWKARPCSGAHSQADYERQFQLGSLLNHSSGDAPRAYKAPAQRRPACRPRALMRRPGGSSTDCKAQKRLGLRRVPAHAVNQPVKPKLVIIKEFWDFLRQRKKWWLAPVVLFLLLLGALLVFAQGSALAPFIYSLF